MPASPEGTSTLFGGRVPLDGGGMRRHAARGALVNGAFQVLILTLGLLKGVVVVAFLTPDEYGVWGVLLVSLVTITWLKQVGAADKFVQQAAPDQTLAFQQAFTIELLFTSAFALLFAALVPLLAVLYGEEKLLLPGLVLALTMPLGVLQSPLWVLYRRMQFTRQRALGSVDPIAGLVVTVALAAAGAGYWSLVVGTVAGLVAGGAAALLGTRYPLALRFDRDVARSYVSFSWPLLVAGAGSLVVAQGSIIAGEAKLGLAGAGFISFASALAFYATRVDTVLTQTIYPAICAARDRTDLLFETFVTSNRLALMWGVPFGVALALFAGDFVSYVVGEDWKPAVFLLQAFALSMGIGHIGHNWDAFYRARGETRPIAIWSLMGTLAFLVLALPLLIVEGLDGYAVGMALVAVVSLVVRAVYLSRMFSGLRVIAYSFRAVVPSAMGAGVVLLLRLLGSAERSGGLALIELTLFVVSTLAATLWVERRLLREVRGYLRSGRGPRAEPAI